MNGFDKVFKKNITKIILKLKIVGIFILLVGPWSFSAGQAAYPADTILVSENTTIIKKIGILPIAGWQRISYRLDFLNCQFYPSCSNYGAQAIYKHGLIFGAFMASDRIIRCNPAAFHYQLEAGGKFYKKDGRLVDPLRYAVKLKPRSNPFTGAALSALIPGMGRVYSGRWIDGLFGFSLFYLTANTGYKAYQDNRPIKAPIFIGAALIIYGGEIYGAYRSSVNNSLTNNTTSRVVISPSPSISAKKN